VEKHDEDIIAENSNASVMQAKFAEKNGKFIRLLYAVYDGVQGNY